MTTIGIIGTGHVGSSLAKAAVAHGYEVVISNSKGPQTLAGLVAELEVNVAKARRGLDPGLTPCRIRERLPGCPALACGTFLTHSSSPPKGT
jgi:nucleoside-diphosphate-sugar epimerase